MPEIVTVKVASNPVRQCISCHRRAKTSNGKCKLTRFPVSKIPEIYLTDEILVPQTKKICSKCLEKLESGQEIRIPSKSERIEKVDPVLLWNVLQRVAKWKQKMTNYQCMTDEEFKEMGTPQTSFQLPLNGFSKI